MGDLRRLKKADSAGRSSELCMSYAGLETCSHLGDSIPSSPLNGWVKLIDTRKTHGFRSEETLGPLVYVMLGHDPHMLWGSPTTAP